MLCYNVFLWFLGKLFVMEVVLIFFSIIFFFFDLGVISIFLFKFGRGFLEWFNCGKCWGSFLLFDMDFVLEILDEWLMLVVEGVDELFVNKV